MTNTNKLQFCYWPVKMVLGHNKGFDFVGWVWWQKAYLTHNLIYGWIAFAQDQLNEELMNPKTCEKCGKLL